MNHLHEVPSNVRAARPEADVLAPTLSAEPSLAPHHLGTLTLAQSNTSGLERFLSSGEFRVIGTIALGVIAIVLVVMLAIPFFRGVGWAFTKLFSAIGWIIVHIFTFLRGMVTDTLRAVGAIIAALLMVPMVLGSVVIGRWSASAHYGRAVQDEFRALGSCVYRVVIGHPARLLFLGGLTEGIERRVPQVMQEAPTFDASPARAGQFDGYTIVGSLPTGGSGAKVYVAEPTPSKKAAFARAGRGDLTQVVIKSFSLKDGSTMPQIVRESRALESARKLGLILDHELSDDKFYYAMPYVPGDSLTTVTRRLHAESGLDGLSPRSLASALSHIGDLLDELGYYHRGGLWHKDVKPDNIIVHDHKAHLVDLGLVTPLRSAMTLTTHGTEYFRDPELVRMALRGAKVNEVDGVKFDIYGAGAVLYSIIENSFPAHGALSQITKKCPEALRWIIRRSMADMHQRYSTAEEMLNDLRAVASAVDPFALKPIDLPSMGGTLQPGVGGQPALVPDLEPRFEPVTFARAASPVPPQIPAAGVHAEDDQGFVFKATIGVGAAAAAAAAGSDPVISGARTRPRLQITDWWTGAYRVLGEDVQLGADRFTRPVRAGRVAPLMPRAPGRTAAEQLRAARDRVESARQRVRNMPGRGVGSFPGRGARGYSNSPNAGVGFAVFALVGVLGFIAFLTKESGSSSTTSQTGIMLDVEGLPGESVFVADQADILSGESPALRDLPALGDTPGTVHAAAENRDVSGGLESGEQWLNEKARQTKALLDKRRPNGDVTFRDVISASLDVLKTDVLAGHADAQGSRRNRSVTPASSPVVPNSASEPTSPATQAHGRVLIVSFLPVEPRDVRHARLDAAIDRLHGADYDVLGIGTSDEDQTLLPAARLAMGLSQPEDPEARQRVKSWLDGTGHLSAVLWVPADGQQNWRLIPASSIEQFELEELAQALRGDIR